MFSDLKPVCGPGSLQTLIASWAVGAEKVNMFVFCASAAGNLVVRSRNLTRIRHQVLDPNIQMPSYGCVGWDARRLEEVAGKAAVVLNE